MNYIISLGREIPKAKRRKLYLLVGLSLASAIFQTLNIALVVPFIEIIKSPIDFLQKNETTSNLLYLSSEETIVIACILFILVCITAGIARVKINIYSKWSS